MRSLESLVVVSREAPVIRPRDHLEAPIVATIPPASYTAVVRGVAETTGVALVEA
jgi:hypothetical protein